MERVLVSGGEEVWLSKHLWSEEHTIAIMIFVVIRDF